MVMKYTEDLRQSQIASLNAYADKNFTPRSGKSKESLHIKCDVPAADLDATGAAISSPTLAPHS